MTSFDTIGEHYAQLLEIQLNAAIQKKLDETSGFKKKLAGIVTADDAKNKGYAPDNGQITQMKAAIQKLAAIKYADAQFCTLSTEHAVAELIRDLSAEIGKLNQSWQHARKFAFDHPALADLTAEATLLLKSEHEKAKKQIV